MTAPASLLDLAVEIQRMATEAGADEVAVSASRSVSTSIARRDGRVEQATEAQSRGVAFSLLVDGRYSSHGTSDLRPEALREFVKRTVAATRVLEPDPYRRLPDASSCGRGSSDEALDQYDPAYEARTAEDRARQVEELEAALEARRTDETISVATLVSDGVSEIARAMSNGFADRHRDGWFSCAGEMSLQDGERRPEASAHFGARYLADLPSAERVATEVVERVSDRIGSGPIPSGTYPLVLLNRSTGRLLGTLAGPLSGGALHQGRSCFAHRKDTRIGAPAFTLIDDPTLPRGLGSRPWDGDGLVARPRTIVDGGILRDFYVNVYYGRRLGLEPTTGGRSNWIVPPGSRSWRAIAEAFPKAILVDGFLGGNSNAVTGDFSFGIRGMLLEYGVKTQSLSEMNVTGNIVHVFERLAEVANDPYRYSSVMVPTLVFEGIQFSGT